MGELVDAPVMLTLSVDDAQALWKLLRYMVSTLGEDLAVLNRVAESDTEAREGACAEFSEDEYQEYRNMYSRALGLLQQLTGLVLN
jgi:hypothetical protein